MNLNTISFLPWYARPTNKARERDGESFFFRFLVSMVISKKKEL
jgi:hypothetical protein